MILKDKIDVLLVEDNPGDARLVELMLYEKGGFTITKATSLAEARESIAAQMPDIVLLDLSLPDSTGMNTVKATRDSAPRIPIVVLTGLNDEAVGLAAVHEGCQDYLVKGEGEGNLIRRTIKYAIERMALEQAQIHHAEQLKRTLTQTVRAISMTIEMRDPYTAGHQRRVAQLCVAIGRKMGLDEETLRGLETGAFIHDIGKINVPADFLSRPGHLSDAAFHVIMAHPQVGYDIVHEIEFPWPIATMILQHHERLDGSGYPNGISGDAIIPEARILAVADVVEAISSHRPYRPSLGIEAAIREIKGNAGTRYDPKVVEACLAVLEEDGFEVSEVKLLDVLF